MPIWVEQKEWEAELSLFRLVLGPPVHPYLKTQLWRICLLHFPFLPRSPDLHTWALSPPYLHNNLARQARLKVQDWPKATLPAAWLNGVSLSNILTTCTTLTVMYRFNCASEVRPGSLELHYLITHTHLGGCLPFIEHVWHANNQSKTYGRFSSHRLSAFSTLRACVGFSCSPFSRGPVLSQLSVLSVFLHFFITCCPQQQFLQHGCPLLPMSVCLSTLGGGGG